MDEFKGNKLRPFFSEPSLSSSRISKKPEQRLVTQSEPNLHAKKSHPLLDDNEDDTPHTYNEVILAAETLENIVEEGAFAGGLRARFMTHQQRHAGREMSDRVLKLVYGTMKFLPYIDHILVKTQFLVFNNQFLNHLPLVKVLVYDAMKYHFNYHGHEYPGLTYDLPPDTKLEDEDYQRQSASVVKDLFEALYAFKVKFSAAYARLRIERKARGDTPREQMENVLPNQVREKEKMAVDMPKTLRINLLKASREEIARQLHKMGYRVILQSLDAVGSFQDDIITVDEDFDDLLIIPGSFFADIKESDLVTQGMLVFQDKASMYGTKQLKSMLKEGAHVIDARAGCGTKTIELSSIVGKKGHIFAFENRPGRLETLRSNLALLGCGNVTIIEEDFSTADISDSIYESVNAIILEPSNSGTALIDKLGYMLQEKEFPNEHFSQKDLLELKRQQVSTLKHAFKFPNVKTIMYVTRSIHTEENEQVVEETLDRYGVNWELRCVLPNITQERQHEYDIDQCLKVQASESVGNGVFVACFTKKSPKKQEKTEEEIAAEEMKRRIAEYTINDIHNEEVDLVASGETRGQSRRRRKSKAKVTPSYKLNKTLSESVARLSVPRHIALEWNSSNVNVRRPKSLGKPSADDDETTVNNGSSQPPSKRGSTSQKVSATTKELDREFDDIGIYGISLKSFYEPRNVAMKSLKIAESATDLSDKMMRWSYPVPNPRPWK